MTFRAPLVVVLTALVALQTLLPREHVHAVEAGDGHHDAVAHRHAAPHAHDEDGGHVHPHTGSHGHRYAAPAHAGASHSHASAGHSHETPAPHARTAGGQAIDHEESVVTELSAPFTTPEEHRLHNPAAVAHAFIAQVAERPILLAFRTVVDRLPHGPPPLPLASRPPPSSARL